MRILAVETSCDETALALLKTSGKKFTIEAHQVASQIALHTQYGGVFPMMAKREHSKNITPLFIETLKDAGLLKKKPQKISKALIAKIEKMLAREKELIPAFVDFISTHTPPKIDRITVTVGPGLEPALWVGINFSKALSLAWDIPLVPVNHMEGHVLSIFPVEKKKDFVIEKMKFPLISLLVSGGHTEIVLMSGFQKYKLIGQTRDDAAGEAFDKVARMMELPYPGGPEISRLATLAREQNIERTFKLPRPMIASKDLDFSFSGLKTACLYLIRDLGILTENKKKEIAREFEDSVVDVLISKTLAAAKKYGAEHVIVGGGVSANKELIKRLVLEAKQENVSVIFPSKKLTTDNAIMIGIAGFFGKTVPRSSKKLLAKGNLQL